MARTPIQIAQARKIQEWVAAGRARELRLAANLTLAAAGQECEADAASIMRWEQGGTTPRGRNVGAYYRFLIGLDALFGDTLNAPADLAQA